MSSEDESSEGERAADLAGVVVLRERVRSLRRGEHLRRETRAPCPRSRESRPRLAVLQSSSEPGRRRTAFYVTTLDPTARISSASQTRPYEVASAGCATIASVRSRHSLS